MFFYVFLFLSCFPRLLLWMRLPCVGLIRGSWFLQMVWFGDPRAGPRVVAELVCVGAMTLFLISWALMLLASMATARGCVDYWPRY